MRVMMIGGPKDGEMIDVGEDVTSFFVSVMRENRALGGNHVGTVHYQEIAPGIAGCGTLRQIVRGNIIPSAKSGIGVALRLALSCGHETRAALPLNLMRAVRHATGWPCQECLVGEWMGANRVNIRGVYRNGATFLVSVRGIEKRFMAKTELDALRKAAKEFAIWPPTWPIGRQSHHDNGGAFKFCSETTTGMAMALTEVVDARNEKGTG